MNSEESSSASLPSLSPWAIVVILIAAMLLVGRVGPETYFGVDDDVVTWGILGVFIAWMLAGKSATLGTRIETNPNAPAAVGEHYRPTATTDDEGVYRVVGAGDEVTLLRVTDSDGRRAHTGEIRHVDQSRLDTRYEAASDPDATVSPLALLRNVFSGFYWTARKFF